MKSEISKLYLPSLVSYVIHETLFQPGSTAKNREDFLTEAAVMGQFKDMNIVALEGVVTQSKLNKIFFHFLYRFNLFLRCNVW